jgi:hypothetical protein
VDGDPLIYTATLDPVGSLPAWLHFDGSTRTFSGTPTNADIGTIAVKVTASDGTLSVSDIFNIAVGNTNDPPVIQNVGGTVTTAEDTPVLLQALLAQVTDADGDTLTMTLGVSGGQLTPSQAILDAIASHALTSSDSDGTDGTLSVTGSAAAIAAAIQAGITYTPDANVNGLDALDVAITDGQATATASVAINITAVNDAPVTTPVTLAAIAEDSGPRLITQAQLLANASDVDNPSLTAVNLQITSGGGSLDNNGDGTWTYHPASNDDTAVTFSYGVSDGTATVATTATLDITAVNDAPVTTPVTLAAIAEDSGPRLITQAQLLANASDVDNPSLTAVNLQITSGGGSLDNNGDGTWTYHPASNDDTAVTFSYGVSDGTATVATTATLDITAVNDAPSGADKTVSTNEDTAYTFTVGDFGFSDIDGNTLQAVKITTLPAAGTLTNNGVAVAAGSFIPVADITGGHLVFTPAANANGTGYASFTFQVQDTGGTANGGVDTDPSANTITIDVTAANDAPVTTITPASYSATEQVALSLKNSGLSISDVDAGASPVTVTLSVGEGTLTVTAGTSGALVSGSGNPSVTISGTVAQINALLNTDGTSAVSYLDNADTPGSSTTLTLSVNDNGNSGTGGVADRQRLGDHQYHRGERCSDADGDVAQSDVYRGGRSGHAGGAGVGVWRRQCQRHRGGPDHQEPDLHGQRLGRRGEREACG